MITVKETKHEKDDSNKKCSKLELSAKPIQPTDEQRDILIDIFTSLRA